MIGLIKKGIGGFYYVETDKGLIEAKGRGIFKKDGITLMVGDNVEISIIDPEKIGYETCAYMGLYLKEPEKFDQVVEELKKIPEVVECHYTTGGFDMFIKIYALNNHHLLEIIHDKLQPLGLSRSETIISFNAAINRQLPLLEIPENAEDEDNGEE